MDNNEFEELEDILDDEEIVSLDTTDDNTMQNSVNSFEETKNAKSSVDRINDMRMNRINKNMKNDDKKSNSMADNLNVKNNYKQQEKNNNAFSDKINSSKIKAMFNRGQSNDEEEGGLKEKIKGEAEKKAAGAAVTAATGGALQGEAAEKVGEVALKATKKYIEKRKKKFYLVIGLIVGITIFFLLMIMFFSGNVDVSDTNANTSPYITGNMSDEELVDYLSYISVCPSTKVLKETYGGDDVLGIISDNDDKLSTCQNAIDYYQAIKEEYKQNTKACYEDRNEDKKILRDFYKHSDTCTDCKLDNNPKAITYFNEKHTIDYGEQVNKKYYDCQLNYPTQLLLETMSYDYTDSELFQNEGLKKRNPDEGIFDDYNVDFRRLSNAASEFVHEACFMWEIKYIDKLGGKHDTPCTGCVEQKEKVPYDGYYFQTSFNKYVCYLKYGDTCNHPNYSGSPIERNEDMEYFEHECVGPSNDVLTSTKITNSTSCKAIGDDIEACNNRSDCEVKDGHCQSKETSDDYDINYGVVSGNGEDVAAYALKYVGNPYVYGGTSLTNGVDCSGFTMKVFQHFGITLPHSSRSQKTIGNEVKSLAEAQAGDLIFYPGHVAIYIGNNQIVHASNEQNGIKISYATYRSISEIRRIIG